MKIKLLLPLLAIVFVGYFSCSKGTGGTDNPTPNPPAAKKKYLSRAVTISTPPTGSPAPQTTTTYDYTYDSKKRLSTITANGVVTTYTYNDSGDLFSIASNAANRTNAEFIYGEGKVKSCVTTKYVNNVQTDRSTYTYVFFNDKVSEVHLGITYDKYYYDQNGNVTKIFHYNSPEFSNVYTFDTSKKSKLVNSLFKFPLPIDPSAEFYSPNARLTMSTEGLPLNPKLTTVYTYNAEGYPTDASATSDYQYSYSYKFTYTYTTLD